VDNKVFAVKCESYDPALINAAVARIFESVGGVKEILKKGNKVLVKPNLLLAKTPGEAVTANPQIVEAVCSMLVKEGADVTVADSPGGPYNDVRMTRIYNICGMTEAAERSGAKLNRDFGHRRVHYSGIKERDFDIIEPVAHADVIITVGKLKTHMLTYFTGAVKNNFGTIPGLEKAKWHSRLPGTKDFAEMICDLCRCVSPDLSIIDGIEGMDGKGPSGGRVRKAEVIFAARNPFAADLAAMHYCGLDPELAPIHKAGVYVNAVPEKYEDLEMLGDEIGILEPPFIPATKVKRSGSVINYLPGFMQKPLRNLFLPYPVPGDRCIGCGDCARACPRSAITISNGKAVVDKKQCIQCYCCHEMCIIKAIDIK